MKTLGIDLDGTLAHYQGWSGPESIGDPMAGAVEFLATCKKEGWTICLWSCRANHVVDAWVSKHNIEHLVDYVNCSPYPTDSIKPSFDLYIGDEAMRFNGSYSDINVSTERHWGDDTFEGGMDATWANQKIQPYYQGTGKLYIDAFEQAYLKLWEARKIEKEIAFFTICSHAKPYSKSYIHMQVRRHLYNQRRLDEVDYIHLSNAGIIPHENGMDYPFCAYDWNGQDANEEAKKYLVQTIKRRMGDWLSSFSHQYKKIIVYLREEGNTCKALQEMQRPPHVHIVAASKKKDLAWALHPDVDDCLTSKKNLVLLNRHLEANDED